MFDWEFLNRTALLESDRFKKAEPYPYIVINNPLSDHVDLDAVVELVSHQEMNYFYSNELEMKMAKDSIYSMPDTLQKYFTQINSFKFLFFLEVLTGIKGLLPDPSYRGGGIHRIAPGGKLNAHVDFNIHPYYGYRRRLNVILFLTDHIDDSGGSLELWDTEGKECVKEITPRPGRMVIFETLSNAYHGHPKPNDFTRLSLATYYYTVAGSGEAPHSTSFVDGDPELVSKRAKSRIELHLLT